MAVAKGTNAGFITVSPTADPVAVDTTFDTVERAVKDTAPAGATKIIEIGWWSGVATEEANFEVGLYSHNAVSDKPTTRLFVAATNAKGTTAGWKKVIVDWTITAGIIYWIAVQLDNTSTASKINHTVAAGLRNSLKSGVSTLSSPWSATSTESETEIYAIYAVWLAGGKISQPVLLNNQGIGWGF